MYPHNNVPPHAAAYEGTHAVHNPFDTTTAATPPPTTRPGPPLTPSQTGSSGSVATVATSGRISEESGLSTYSPIATLEEQYVEPIGQRLFLFVKSNPHCCLEGGVETLLKKMKRLHKSNSSNPGSNNNSATSGHSSVLNDTNASTTKDLMSRANSFGDMLINDPFSFMYDGYPGNDAPQQQQPSQPPQQQQPPQPQPPNSTSTVAPAPGSGGFGTFFKKAVKSTQQSLERKMQEIAIRTDPAGREPDLYTVAIYLNDNVLISATDSVVPTKVARVLPSSMQPSSYPASPNPTTNNQAIQPSPLAFTSRGGDPAMTPPPSNTANTPTTENILSFDIPLVLPPNLDTNSVITIKLWIKSQAFFKKQYLLGWVSMQLHQLKQLVAYQTYSTLQVDLQSPYLSSTMETTKDTTKYPRHKQQQLPPSAYTSPAQGGQLHILVTQDHKIPHPNQGGWSLTDPKLSGYASGLFHLPLDQPYNLHIPRPSPLAIFTIGMERATESSIVLPIATAMTKLYSNATKVSTNHAIYVAQNLLANRHDSPTTIQPLSSTTTPLYHAKCDIRVGLVQPDTTTNSNLNLATCVISWQPPDCIFEVELLPSTSLPIQPPQQPQQLTIPQFQPIKGFSFYPRVCTTNILPTILGAYGGKLPDSGYCIGNLKIQIAMKRNVPKNRMVVPPGVRPIHQSSSRTNIPDANDNTTNSNTANSTNTNNDPMEIWESILVLENLANRHKHQQQQQGSSSSTIPVALYHSKTGVKMGTLFLSLELNVNPNLNKQSTNPISPSKGLVSLMGLDTLDIIDNCLPLSLDCEYRNTVTTDERRQRQICTLGSFISHSYLDTHITNIRIKDHEMFVKRSKEYSRALASTGQQQQQKNDLTFSVLESEPLSHEIKIPRPFRPSSSRSEDLLSCIPFNVHNASYTIDTFTNTDNNNQASHHSTKDIVFSNITCGAPADHARGFGNVFGGSNNNGGSGSSGSNNPPSFGKGSVISPLLNASGGLRRLEAKRIELAQQVYDSQTNLITGVTNFFAQTRMNGQKYINHIPGRHLELQALRYKVFETIQAYHHLTWHIAIRRSNTFSQALAIAVTAYVTALSDPVKLKYNWAELWSKHGFLITFEGLLSAAGKELGMIEDASVAIDMLKFVSVVLLPADQQQPPPQQPNIDQQRVDIPHSSFLKWLNIIAITGTSNSQQQNNGTRFIVQLGIAPEYYYNKNQQQQQQYRTTIPECLKNGTHVSLYPLLFQVGVDIRQWGAHAGSNMKNQFNSANNTVNTAATNITTYPTAISDASTISTTNSSTDDITTSALCGATGAAGNGLLDDEDDDVGIPDDDVLVALNYEAFQKLNAYAYAVWPVKSANAAIVAATPMMNSQQQQQVTAHPSLAMLQGHIVTSAGKMNHSILDEAATIVQQLGGGGAVFCKSGKDRTAMHVTYKMAQFVSRYKLQQMNNSGNNDNVGIHAMMQLQQQQQQQQNETNNTAIIRTLLQDATKMRIYGTRLPICEKNVGQALYAFNSLQTKFMPDALKPPPNTLAGFLKGGRVFQPGGGIET